MLSKWPIRVKFLVGLSLLLLLVMILSGSGLYATYAFRSLVKTLSWRAVELPLAAKLSRQVSELRITLSELRGLRARTFPHSAAEDTPLQVWMVRDQIRTQLAEVEDTLDRYRRQLETNVRDGSPIADNQQEWATLHKIEAALVRVHQSNREVDWMLDDAKVGRLNSELEGLQALSAELPSHLHGKIGGFAHEVRAKYRMLIVGTWAASVVAALIFLVLLRLFYQWIFRPLRILIGGSRMVAAGQFDYRIHLQTHDEMSELAEAMNDMTERFQVIRDDLDRQVQERTKQVVRSEQLASVGFLAAGVAHEINNPLASIALCAESLEGRVLEILDENNEEHIVIRNYLRMIQTEAFRCKEITEKLLDFSRTGQVRRQATDMAELVQGVIEMVGHLGKYHRKRIQLEVSDPVVLSVNPQEMKQVVLNLLTNALDSIEQDGLVRVCLGRREGLAELAVVDNGCGMTPDVLEHVFEPFFTRRRAGQGTGLGLSITYRIVSDHGGEIEAFSAGPGQGAVFRVRLPLVEKEKKNHYQAA
ncbi:MAG: HAMP domain-containing protein [Pirellulales bacterium]|nr:HAMP domain-containing protein [Pirellulales bacterium]